MTLASSKVAFTVKSGAGISQLLNQARDSPRRESRSPDRPSVFRSKKNEAFFEARDEIEIHEAQRPAPRFI